MIKYTKIPIDKTLQPYFENFWNPVDKRRYKGRPGGRKVCIDVCAHHWIIPRLRRRVFPLEKNHNDAISLQKLRFRCCSCRKQSRLTAFGAWRIIIDLLCKLHANFNRFYLKAQFFMEILFVSKLEEDWKFFGRFYLRLLLVFSDGNF